MSPAARLRRLEHAHAVTLDLPRPARVQQHVHVAQHLAEREVSLGDRDVAPERLSDLVRRAWPLGDKPVDLAGAPLVKREALVDQRAVVGDRLAVARKHQLDVHLARGA